MENVKTFFLDSSTRVFLGAIAVAATFHYGVTRYIAKAHQNQIKTKIEKLNKQNDSINEASISNAYKLSIQLDYLSANPTYSDSKAKSDSLLKEIDNVKNAAERKIALNEQEIMRLTNELTR